MIELDYPEWAIPAEAFAPGAWKIWRRQLKRAWRRLVKA